MNVAVPVLLGLSAATFMMVTLPSFLRNIFPQLGSRVQYRDGQYLVSVRYPGQWNEIREFVQPNNPDVIAIYSQIGPDIWSCLDFVCRNISYRRDIGEWWSLPVETLARATGDCEDSTFVFVSLARNFDPNVWAVLGSYQGYGHSWASENGFIYETTYTEARAVPDPEAYEPMVMFNELEVFEIYPGALREVFELRRNEATKLNLIASALT